MRPTCRRVSPLSRSLRGLGRPAILSLALFVSAAPAPLQEFRYRYVDLSEVALPADFLFWDPVAIGNDGRIFATAWETTDIVLVPHVAVYRDGAITIRQPGMAVVANSRGTVGGAIVDNAADFTLQAALFYDDRVELIPRQPDEVSSVVEALNDSGTAVVSSLNSLFEQSLLIYQNGRTTRLSIDGLVTFLRISNQGLVCGTVFVVGGDRGFCHDPRTSSTTYLNPEPTEPSSWAMDVNAKGQVLGYSFAAGGTERIGVWGRDGRFHTYFVQGTPEFPTSTNKLLFNDSDLIVATLSFLADTSYLIPAPGVRLDLFDLVNDVPPGAQLTHVKDLNDHGDMIGDGGPTGRMFLLQRIDRR